MNEIITLIIILLSGMLVISVAYNWFKEREIKSLKKQLLWTEEKHAALQKEHLLSFINPHKSHELSSEIIEKHIQEIKTEIKRRKKPSIPKPRFKGVQNQIDEEHERLKEKAKCEDTCLAPLWCESSNNSNNNSDNGYETTDKSEGNY